MSFETVSLQQLVGQKADLEAEIGDLSALSTSDKSSIVAAVNELFTSAGNGKVAIAAAVTGKGVPTSESDTFAQMAENIGEIETGITPTGTKVISANGTYDVTQYASANVNVSAEAPTLITKSITANGTYNASSDSADGYSSVSVNVPTGSTNSRCFKMEISSDLKDSQWHYFNSADADIAAHKDDQTFVVTVMNITDFDTAKERTIGVTATNHKTNSFSSNVSFGMLLKANSSGVTGYGGTAKAVTTTSPASGGSQIHVDADGKIGIYGSVYVPWVAGSYVAICGW